MGKSIQKIICLLVSAFHFTTQVALAGQVEASFWSERRTSGSQTELNPHPQLALLPNTLHPTSPYQRIIQGFRSPNANVSGGEWSQNVRSDQIPGYPAINSPALKKLAMAIPFNRGVIQEISDGITSQVKPIVIVQDIHLNSEAQTNIASILQTLIDNNLIGMIGVEGAFAPIDVSAFRKLSKPEITKFVADSYLRHGRIGAPAYIGLTSPTAPPPLVGVDDKTHYQANVNAYLSGRNEQNPIRQALDQTDAVMKQELDHLPNTQLKKFHALMRSYHRGELNYGQYLLGLNSFGKTNNSVVGQFLEAFQMESQLDFNGVEIERKKLLQKLTAILSETELQDLLVLSGAYRDGRIGFAHFYRTLKNICSAKGLNLRSLPTFDRYLRYVFLSDGIKPSLLFVHAKKWEENILHSLAQTPNERLLFSKFRAIELTRKLITFSLTTDEWIDFLSLKKDGVIPNLPLGHFETFYREAEIRSGIMLIKLLESDTDRAPILVTGGFHTSDLIQRIKAVGIPYIVVTPKLTKFENESGPSYLSIFAKEKPMIEKLFSGEKLFINPTSATLADPMTRFRIGGGAQARLEQKRTIVWKDQHESIQLEVHTAAEPIRDQIRFSWRSTGLKMMSRVVGWLHRIQRLSTLPQLTDPNQTVTVLQAEAVATPPVNSIRYLQTANLMGCVGLALWDVKTKVGLLAHIDQNTDLPMTFKLIEKELQDRGVKPGSLKGFVVGGNPRTPEEIFKSIDGFLDDWDIRNVYRDIRKEESQNLGLDLQTGVGYYLPTDSAATHISPFRLNTKFKEVEKRRQSRLSGSPLPIVFIEPLSDRDRLESDPPLLNNLTTGNGPGSQPTATWRMTVKLTKSIVQTFSHIFPRLKEKLLTPSWIEFVSIRYVSWWFETLVTLGIFALFNYAPLYLGFDHLNPYLSAFLSNLIFTLGHWKGIYAARPNGHPFFKGFASPYFWPLVGLRSRMMAWSQLFFWGALFHGPILTLLATHSFLPTNLWSDSGLQILIGLTSLWAILSHQRYSLFNHVQFKNRFRYHIRTMESMSDENKKYRLKRFANTFMIYTLHLNHPFSRILLSEHLRSEAFDLNPLLGWHIRSLTNYLEKEDWFTRRGPVIDQHLIKIRQILASYGCYLSTNLEIDENQEPHFIASLFEIVRARQYRQDGTWVVSLRLRQMTDIIYRHDHIGHSHSEGMAVTLEDEISRHMINGILPMASLGHDFFHGPIKKMIRELLREGFNGLFPNQQDRRSLDDLIQLLTERERLIHQLHTSFAARLKSDQGEEFLNRVKIENSDNPVLEILMAKMINGQLDFPYQINHEDIIILHSIALKLFEPGFVARFNWVNDQLLLRKSEFQPLMDRLLDALVDMNERHELGHEFDQEIHRYKLEHTAYHNQFVHSAYPAIDLAMMASQLIPASNILYPTNTPLSRYEENEEIHRKAQIELFTILARMGDPTFKNLTLDNLSILLRNLLQSDTKLIQQDLSELLDHLGWSVPITEETLRAGHSTPEEGIFWASGDFMGPIESVEKLMKYSSPRERNTDPRLPQIEQPILTLSDLPQTLRSAVQFRTDQRIDETLIRLTELVDSIVLSLDNPDTITYLVGLIKYAQFSSPEALELILAQSKKMKPLNRSTSVKTIIPLFFFHIMAIQLKKYEIDKRHAQQIYRAMLDLIHSTDLNLSDLIHQIHLHNIIARSIETGHEPITKLKLMGSKLTGQGLSFFNLPDQEIFEQLGLSGPLISRTGRNGTDEENAGRNGPWMATLLSERPYDEQYTRHWSWLESVRLNLILAGVFSIPLLIGHLLGFNLEPFITHLSLYFPPRSLMATGVTLGILLIPSALWMGWHFLRDLRQPEIKRKPYGTSDEWFTSYVLRKGKRNYGGMGLGILTLNLGGILPLIILREHLSGHLTGMPLLGVSFALFSASYSLFHFLWDFIVHWKWALSLRTPYLGQELWEEFKKLPPLPAINWFVHFLTLLTDHKPGGDRSQELAEQLFNLSEKNILIGGGENEKMMADILTDRIPFSKNRVQYINTRWSEDNAVPVGDRFPQRWNQHFDVAMIDLDENPEKNIELWLEEIKRIMNPSGQLWIHGSRLTPGSDLLTQLIRLFGPPLDSREEWGVFIFQGLAHRFIHPQVMESKLKAALQRKHDVSLDTIHLITQLLTDGTIVPPLSPSVGDLLNKWRSGTILDAMAGRDFPLNQVLVRDLQFDSHQIFSIDPAINKADQSEERQALPLENMPDDWKDKFDTVFAFAGFNPEVVDNTRGLNWEMDVSKAAHNLFNSLKLGGHLIIVTGTNGFDHEDEWLNSSNPPHSTRTRYHLVKEFGNPIYEQGGIYVFEKNLKRREALHAEFIMNGYFLERLQDQTQQTKLELLIEALRGTEATSLELGHIQKHHSPATIEMMANRFENALRQGIEYNEVNKISESSPPNGIDRRKIPFLFHNFSRFLWSYLTGREGNRYAGYLKRILWPSDITASTHVMTAFLNPDDFEAAMTEASRVVEEADKNRRAGRNPLIYLVVNDEMMSRAKDRLIRTIDTKINLIRYSEAQTLSALEKTVLFNHHLKPDQLPNIMFHFLAPDGRNIPAGFIDRPLNENEQTRYRFYVLLMNTLNIMAVEFGLDSVEDLPRLARQLATNA